MNKLRYEKPFAEIVEFDTSDVVVVASGDSGGSSSTADCKHTFNNPGTYYFCTENYFGQGQGNGCRSFLIFGVGQTSL